MQVEIPVIIHHFCEKSSRKDFISIRPLFYDDPIVTSDNLYKTTELFRKEWLRCHKIDSPLIENSNLQSLLNNPKFTTLKTTVNVELGGRYFSLSLWIQYWEINKVMFWYTHQLQNFLFMTEPTNNSETQLSILCTCLKNWYLRRKKYCDKNDIFEELQNLDSFTPLSFSSVMLRIPEQEVFYHFNINETDHYSLIRNGIEECQKTGSCIEWTPSPTEMADHDSAKHQPIKLRTLENRIYNILNDKKRKSILLYGPEGSGRSHLLTRLFKRLDRENNYEIIRKKLSLKNIRTKLCWHFSPGRLIAGMSKVGEFEKRVNAIFAATEYMDNILYFDQIVGLLETGHHSEGDLAITDYLLDAIKNERLRVVFKVTPEQLRILNEKNRALAELFEILPMPALSDDECNKIYIGKIQNLEDTYCCRFDLEAIPLLKKLTHIFEPHKGAPGPVCDWLTNLAILKGNDLNSPIQQSEILNHFKLKTGMELGLFDLNSRVERKENSIRDAISENLIGQKEAIDLMTDFTIRSESFFGDPGRPLFSFLFVGPTGVGKTESAKQLAKYFFGNEDRLIRFDTNELTTAESVSALIGNAFRDGTLTGRIRLNPFCVLLFDEIEKAHPSLFDLLLQVLGEGRLTDGKGQLVSFTQCIIILTSNLGARDAAKGFGFLSEDADQTETYYQAIQEFFRPEFLNRLDRIVPFKKLSENELSLVAERFISQLDQREGFIRYHCSFYLTEQARKWFISRGNDPRWGARKTIRSLEKELVTPLSAILAAQAESDVHNIIDISLENNRPKLVCYPVPPSKSLVIWRYWVSRGYPLVFKKKEISSDRMNDLNRLINLSNAKCFNWIIEIAKMNNFDLFNHDHLSKDDPKQNKSPLEQFLFFLWDVINRHIYYDDGYYQEMESYNENKRSRKMGLKSVYIDLDVSGTRMMPYVRGNKNKILLDQLSSEGLEDLHLKNLPDHTEVERYEYFRALGKINYLIEMMRYLESGIPAFNTVIVMFFETGLKPLGKNLEKRFKKCANSERLRANPLSVYQFEEDTVWLSDQIIQDNLFGMKIEDQAWFYEGIGVYYWDNLFHDFACGAAFQAVVDDEILDGMVLTGPDMYNRACHFSGTSGSKCAVVFPWPENSDDDPNEREEFSISREGAAKLRNFLKEWLKTREGIWKSPQKGRAPVIPKEFLPFVEFIQD